MTEPIPYLSVCSGIEAFSVAVEPLGFTPRAFAEIEAFPSAVLRHWWPGVPNLGDMTAIDTDSLGHVGWLVGGTPCQSFSVAGLRQSLDDERGNLTLEYVRIAHALAEKNGLRGALWENVPGCLNTKDNAFGCFLGALVGADGPLLPPGGNGWPGKGMVAGPRARLAWRVLNSQFFGVPQRRRRVYVVIDFGDGPDPAAVLFEQRGKGRRAAASRQAREEIAGTLGGSSQDGGFRTTDLDNNGAFVVAHTLRADGFDASEDGSGRGTPLVVDTAPTLRAGGNKTGGDRPPGSDVDTVETLVVYLGNAEGGNPEAPSLNASNGKKGVNNQTALVAVFDPNQITNPDNRSRPAEELAHALPAQEQAPVLFAYDLRNASEGEVTQTLQSAGLGTERGANPNAIPHVVAFTSKDHGQDAGELSPSLRAAGSRKNHPNGGAPPAIAFLGTGNGEGAAEDLSPAVRAHDANAIAFNLRGREGGNMPELGGDQASALRGADGGSSAPMALTGPQVRRLTPTECERLQGFQDGHTLIPGHTGWRAVGDDEDIEELRESGLEVRVSKKTGKARVNDPDGPRYKGLGNSFTVEVINWIMSRAEASMAGLPMPDWQPLALWKRGRKRAL